MGPAMEAWMECVGRGIRAECVGEVSQGFLVGRSILDVSFQ